MNLEKRNPTRQPANAA